MAKIPNEAVKKSSSLAWSWRPEKTSIFAKDGKGQFAKDVLLEQKAATNDTSDYLWYMTRVNLDEKNDNMRIRINSSAHVLHVYVNGHEIGYEYANDSYIYTFEKKVQFKKGTNVIALLSATVGLKNYGPFFDMTPVGITGPVEIVEDRGNETVVVKDLSSHVWTYKTGLLGLDHEKLYSEKSPFANRWKISSKTPINARMMWYKTTFKAPLGTEPVVVDLSSMSKGEAWVNGKSIGRYWPSFLASEDGCTVGPCDYRGQYDNNKCLANCGKPIQTEYHVPRSFLRKGDNTLVLFEEFGGNPAHVNFKTVRVGGACASAYEGNIVKLSCERRPITGIKFASFGDPQGVCGSFVKGSCEGANDAKHVLTKACVGKETCLVDVSSKTFGVTSFCEHKIKKLAVEIVC